MISNFNVKFSQSFCVSYMNVLFHDDATFSGNYCDASDYEHVRDCDVSDCVRGYRIFLLELLCRQN